MNNKTSLAALAAAAIAVCAGASPGRAQDHVQFSTGVDYSSGDYGDAVDTDMLAVPLGVKIQSGNFTLRGSVPYLEVEGPEGVIPGDGGVSGGGAAAPVTKRTGIGDTNLSATYTLPLGARTFFDATGKVKLPTGSEAKYLSTGTTDFTLQGELTQAFGNSFIAARAGRRFNGSNPTYPLRHVWLAGAGVYHVAGPVTLGLDYNWREGSLATSPDRSEATASVSYKLNPSFLVQGYAYKGFADGSPDLGGGVQLLYRIGM